MKIYLAIYDNAELTKDDFKDKDLDCFLTEEAAAKDIRNYDAEGYVVECEITSIKATFPPKSDELYPVKIDLK